MARNHISSPKSRMATGLKHYRANELVEAEKEKKNKFIEYDLGGPRVATNMK